MTPETFLKMNTNKDGSINQTAQKSLAKIEADFGQALAKTKDELVKNPPTDIPAYNGRYIDYRNAQDAITKAEQTASNDNLTHYIHPTLITIPIPTAQGIRKIQRLGVETILQYKWLTLYAGAVPVKSTNGNNGRQNNAGQDFGKGLTTAERQSLSMVFGIRHRSDNDPSLKGNNNGQSGYRNYNSGYHQYNTYNQGRSYNNGRYNNGGSKNFSRVGNSYNSKNNKNSNYYPQSNNNIVNNTSSNTATNASNATKSNNASTSGVTKKSSSSSTKSVERITTAQAKKLKKRIDAVIKSGGMNKTLALNTVKRMTDVKQNKQLNYLPVVKYNKAMKMLESFIKPKK